MSEPNRAVQEEELEALRAIFEDDWQDIPPKKTAWGTESEGGWWEVKLRNDDGRVSVGLRGRMTKLYPDQAPPLLLVDPIGLTGTHVHTLHKLLVERAKASVGAPMIFDLADLCREWITHNHIPLPKAGEVAPTLMEEMAQREEAQRAAEAAQTEAEHVQRQAVAEEQNRLMTEKIQLDASRKEERARQSLLEEAARRRQESLASLADGEMEMRELVLDEPISVTGFDGKWANWILFGGKREPLWTVYTAEPDGILDGFLKASLPTISVQVVDFSTAYYSTAHGRKRVDAVAVEIARLRDIRCENVTRILGVKRDTSPKGWERLIVLVEKNDGGKLSSWLPKDGYGEDTARDYVAQILSGLGEIHRRGATQKQLDLDCILITPSPTHVTLQLSGTGYGRRIADLHRSNPFLRSYEDNIPESWLSPDEIDSPQSYAGKRDIWSAGLVLLQLLFGSQVLWRFQNLSTLLQHAPGTSDTMVDLLNGLLNPSHKKRLTTDEALVKLRIDDDITRRAIKWPSTQSLNHPGPSSPRNILSSSPGDRMGGSGFLGSAYQPNASRLSRYRTDFEEVEFLGKGGFGEVVKARNKLDGRSYAIKKVKLRPEDNEQKVYREVNSLSRVSHQYIVRYYGCWLEDAARPELLPSSEESNTPSASVPTNSTAEEEDIFATNFDDLSLSRRDQSRSASFPRIRFTTKEDDDDDSDDSDSGDDDSESSDAATAADPSELRVKAIAVPPKPSFTGTGTTTDDGIVQRILYIQMEFVEKQTLKEAITAGLSDDEVWRLLGQILQALAHMSSLGIVHRDLKPSNILLDANGNVKIADFGLSTTEMSAVESSAGIHSEDPDWTSNIGTSLYIAPEVAISRSYNEKADMYSLGVIFFEMCYAFKTGMERVHILNALRQPSITFPAGWPPNVKSNQREIVSWLLRHDPAARPQATQLLASPLLPSPEKQKEYYDTAIAELTNPKSSQFPALLEALFDTPSRSYSTSFENRLDDYTYDNDHDDELQVWLTVVVSRLVDLLQRHGAFETNLPLLMPETTLLDAFPDLTPVRLLDQNGKVVQLPCSDLLAMARSATRRGIERIKRYHVGARYAEHARGGQPAVTGQLSFDIVSPIRSAAADAELLEVVDKVISEFRGMRGTSIDDYEFHVSHESVLASILASVPDRSRPHVLKAFKSMSASTSVTQARQHLSTVAGLPKQVLDDLEQCCQAGDFEQIRGKIETVFPASRRKLTAALDETAAIIKLGRACGITRKIVFRPTLSRNAEFFRGGFMFECVRRTKQREIIAFGGRYDSLLEHFKQPAHQIQSRRVFGVGMSLAVDVLAKVVRRYEVGLAERLMDKERVEERSFGFWSPTRCDVYVAAGVQVDLVARLGMTGEFWRAGIRADLQYDDERGQEEVAEECQDQNILFLVIPRSNRPSVKVRSILRRTEEEVPRNELIVHLRQAITEQRRIDASYASAEGSIPSAQAAALSVEPSRGQDLDVRLVLPPEPIEKKGTKGRPVRKHRHVTKSVYYEKASEFLQHTKSTLPLYGLDLAPSLLSQLCLDPAWIWEDEPWRAILSSLQTPERRYVESVREAIRDGSRKDASAATGTGGAAGGGVVPKGGGSVWLFSVRDAKGFLLQLK